MMGGLQWNPVQGGEGRTYTMITYVEKESNLGPEDKLGIPWVLKVRFLFCKVQLVALTSYIHIECYHFME